MIFVLVGDLVSITKWRWKKTQNIIFFWGNLFWSWPLLMQFTLGRWRTTEMQQVKLDGHDLLQVIARLVLVLELSKSG